MSITIVYTLQGEFLNRRAVMNNESFYITVVIRNKCLKTSRYLNLYYAEPRRERNV